MKDLLLMLLIACSLTACTSTEIVHTPIGCLGQPVTSVDLTQEEYDSMSTELLNKFLLHSQILRKRIDTQCEINLNYDKLYEGNNMKQIKL